jgi:hypothetical protein
MKKLLVGFLLFGVLYFVGCIAVGGIAGGIAGSHQESAVAAERAGRLAGAKAVTNNRGFIVAGAAVLAVLGSNAGLLAGLRRC